jgi:hypothetical protein
MRSSLARLLALAFVCPAVAAASRALRGAGATASVRITKSIATTTLTDWLQAAPHLAEFIDETAQSC